MSERMEKLLAGANPFPMCIINNSGKVTRASASINEVFIYEGIRDSDIIALTGFSRADLDSEERGEKVLTLSRNDKVFRIRAKSLENSTTGLMAVFFLDVTGYEALKELYNDEKLCLMQVNVDNFDELIATTGEDKRYEVTAEIDRTIRQWAAKLNASITRYKEYQYIVVTDAAACARLIEGRFQILDDIRKIETEVDFPVTLSIGIGMDGKTTAQTDQYSADALELALGRGGDQVVIKSGSKIDYYGGTTQTVEKSNKGKSRIVAHALKQFVDNASKVMVMGHKNPDLDSFGAALGIYRFAQKFGKETFIVVDKYNEALEVMYNQALEIGTYNLINNEKALEEVDEETLVVVVDTGRPQMTECPELLTKTELIAVIDHHRKSADAIESPLSYIESYASSACELITEMLQTVSEKKSLPKFEADALLAGITLDTNRFSIKTGVRTFEAASWLRRCGADTTAVKKYFQTEVDTFKLRAEMVAHAKPYGDGIELAVGDGIHQDAQIINSQVADDLLTMKGVESSFVASRESEKITAVSARSVGKINVQTMMEALGGGGHMNAAGAQVEMSPEEVMDFIKEWIEKLRNKEERE